MRRKIILTLAIGAMVFSGCAKKYEKIDTTTLAQTIEETTEAETEIEEDTESAAWESSAEEVSSKEAVETSKETAETSKATEALKAETAAAKVQTTKAADAETPNLLGKGDTTDDPERDAKEEIENYYIGNHTRSDDGSELTIEKTGDWKFKVDLSIFRLCYLEGGVGTYDSHKINVQFDDPNGNKMSAVIYRDGDNNLAVRITDSSWDYLPNGEILDGFGK